MSEERRKGDCQIGQFTVQSIRASPGGELEDRDDVCTQQLINSAQYARIATQADKPAD